MGRRSYRGLWESSWFSTCFVVFTATRLDEPTAGRLTESAWRYAVENRSKSARARQENGAAVAVFVTAAVDDVVRDWFGSRPKLGYLVYRIPVLVELDTRTLTFRERRHGFNTLHQRSRFRLVREVVGPAVTSLDPGAAALPPPDTLRDWPRRLPGRPRSGS